MTEVERSEPQFAGALYGVRIIETGAGVAAAYCGFLLAGLGADVLKVEPLSGDPARLDGPFSADLPDPECSGRFLHLNRGKRSVALDLASEPDRSWFLSLVATSDVLLDDHSPATQADLGLDDTTIRAAQPSLILTRISLFGENGPYAGWQGTELVVQAMSGLMACTGEPDREPLLIGGSPAQYAGGQTAAAATLVALFDRASDNVGTRLDVSVQEAATDLLELWSHGAYQNRAMPRLGARHNSGYPFEAYPCSDGYVGVHTRPGPWSAMADMVDARLADPRYEDAATREQFRAEIDPLICTWLANKTKFDAYHAGQARRFAFGYVATASDLLKSPHLHARDALVPLEHPTAGTLRYPGAPFRMRSTPWRDQRAPLLDEHGVNLTPRPPSLAGKGEPNSAVVDLNSPFPAREGGRGVRSASHLPLSGVRVVDLTQIWAGPRCTKVLADYGADVIKVEPLKRTDSTRSYNAFLAMPGDHGADAERVHNRRLGYEQLHRGQRSVTLDLTDAIDRERLFDLVRVSDVLAANFAYGVLERLGITYDDLVRVRPDIIVLSMTGFGDSGPERDYVAFGVTQEELSGVYGLTGYLGERPLKSGPNIGDPMNGMHGACAVLAALLHRTRTGEGQYIEFSQLESSLPLIGEALLDVQMNGRDALPGGNAHRSWAPHGVYPCRGTDRWITIACRSDAEWQRLCDAMERPDLVTDHRFATAAARRSHGAVLDRQIGDWTRGRDSMALASKLQACGVASGPVLNSIDIGADDHLRDRGFLPVIRHPDGVDRNYYGPLWRIDSARPALRGPAPLLGEHNDVVFGELLGVC
ncbi:MAG: CaiB/BaiF CoA transferase family protein [Dehalococcoidia bacterium]